MRLKLSKEPNIKYAPKTWVFRFERGEMSGCAVCRQEIQDEWVYLCKHTKELFHVSCDPKHDTNPTELSTGGAEVHVDYYGKLEVEK